MIIPTGFTGWVDCPLSEEGEKEAVQGGKLMKEEGFIFDKAYTSTLKRAIKTLWLSLEQLDVSSLADRPIQCTPPSPKLTSCRLSL